MPVRLRRIPLPGRGFPVGAPPFVYPASISVPALQKAPSHSGPLTARLEPHSNGSVVVIEGYLERRVWWRAKTTRPSGAARWGPATVQHRMDGSTPWVQSASDRWWEVFGPDSHWATGVTEDGEWNVCAAHGDFEYPYLTVSELGTVLERRSQGLARSLLDGLRIRTGLQPIPEIVNADEEEGLAIPFWRGYLSRDLSALVDRLSGGEWGRVTDMLRRFREKRREEHDRIVFGVDPPGDCLDR
jgi:hypothetical protein